MGNFRLKSAYCLAVLLPLHRSTEERRHTWTECSGTTMRLISLTPPLPRGIGSVGARIYAHEKDGA
jgi:hypothetical protein